MNNIKFPNGSSFVFHKHLHAKDIGKGIKGVPKDIDDYAFMYQNKSTAEIKRGAVVFDSNSCVMKLIPPQPKKQKEQTCKYCGSNYIELTLSGQCKNCNAFIF